MTRKFALYLVACSALSCALSSTSNLAPAHGQGLMENTSLQGTAAGLGGGLGASAYKLFNATPGGAAGKATNAVSGARKSVQQSAGAPTAAEIKSKTMLLDSTAKQKAEAGDLSGAAKAWQELAQFRQKAVGKEDALAGDAFQKAGTTMLTAKLYSQAEDCLKMSLGYSNRINGADSPKARPILVDLANSLKEQDRVAEAIPYYKQALTLEEKSSTTDPKASFLTKANLGEAYFKAGTYSEAEPLLKQSIETAQKSNYYNKDEMAGLLKTYASTLEKNNKTDEAAQVTKSINALDQKQDDVKTPH